MTGCISYQAVILLIGNNCSPCINFDLCGHQNSQMNEKKCTLLSSHLASQLSCTVVSCSLPSCLTGHATLAPTAWLLPVLTEPLSCPWCSQTAVLSTCGSSLSESAAVPNTTDHRLRRSAEQAGIYLMGSVPSRPGKFTWHRESGFYYMC